jgi:hypothetical protein
VRRPLRPRRALADLHAGALREQVFACGDNDGALRVWDVRCAGRTAQVVRACRRDRGGADGAAQVPCFTGTRGVHVLFGETGETLVAAADGQVLRMSGV